MAVLRWLLVVTTAIPLAAQVLDPAELPPHGLVDPTSYPHRPDDGTVILALDPAPTDPLLLSGLVRYQGPAVARLRWSDSTGVLNQCPIEPGRTGRQPFLLSLTTPTNAGPFVVRAQIPTGGVLLIDDLSLLPGTPPESWRFPLLVAWASLLGLGGLLGSLGALWAPGSRLQRGGAGLALLAAAGSGITGLSWWLTGSGMWSIGAPLLVGAVGGLIGIAIWRIRGTDTST